MSPNEIEKALTNRLEELTYKGTVTWTKDGQTYRAIYKNMVFKIEDSGQNWLEIEQENTGQNLGLIRDYMGSHDVEALLDAIKNVSICGSASNQRHVDTRGSDLRAILEALNKEA